MTERHVTPIPLLTIALLVTVALFALVMPVELPRLPQRTADQAPITYTAPPFNLSVTASGGVEVPMPTENIPDFPGCDDIDPALCAWKAKLSRQVDGSDTIIQTDLEVNGKVVGRAQVMEIETADYAELEPLARMGHDKAWISHIQVARAYRLNGLGRALWHASDAMIKTLVGTGNAVHILVDQAGWGEALMKDIPSGDVVYRLGDTWVYIIR